MTDQQPERNETGEVWKGIGLTLLLHLIQIPIAALSGGVAVIGIGLSQLLYVVPAVIIAHRKGRKGLMKGIIIAAAITFLLNAACFGVIFVGMGGI